MNDLEKLYELIKSASPSFGLSIEAFAESMNNQSYVDSLRSWASESSQEIVDEIDSFSVKKKDGTSQEEGTVTLQEETISSEPARLETASEAEQNVREWSPFIPSEKDLETLKEKQPALERQAKDYLEEEDKRLEEEAAKGEAQVEFEKSKPFVESLEQQNLKPIYNDMGEVINVEKVSDEKVEYDDFGEKLSETLREEARRTLTEEDKQALSSIDVDGLSSYSKDEDFEAYPLGEVAKLNRESIQQFYKDAYSSMIMRQVPKEYSDDAVNSLYDLAILARDEFRKNPSNENKLKFEKAKSDFSERIKGRIQAINAVQDKMSSLSSNEIAFLSGGNVVGRLGVSRLGRGRVEDGRVNEFQMKVFDDYESYLDYKEGDARTKQIGDLTKAQAFDFFSKAFAHQKKIIDAEAKKQRAIIDKSDLSEIKKQEALEEINSKQSVNSFLLASQATDFFNRNYDEWRDKVLKEADEAKAQQEKRKKYQEYVDAINKDAEWDGWDGLDRFVANKIYNNVTIPISAALTGLISGAITFPRTVGLNGENIRYLTGSPELQAFADKLTDGADKYLSSASYQKYLPTRLKESYDENGNINWAGMRHKALMAGAEMATLLVGTGLVTKASKFLPKASVRIRRGTALAGVSFVQQHQRNFMTAKDLGLSDAEASAYALPVTTVTSLLELVSPNELIAGQLNPTKWVTKNAAKRMAEGLTRKEAISEAVSLWFKEVGAENVQEIMQGLSEILMNKAANTIIGDDIFHDDFDFKELQETVIVTTLLTGTLAGGRVATRKRDSDQLKTASILTAVNNIDKTKGVVESMLKKNKIDQQQADLILDNLKEADKIFSGMPEKLTDNQKIGIYSLVNQKRQIMEAQKNAYVDPLFKKEDQTETDKKLGEINVEINKVLNPDKDAVQKQQTEEGMLRPKAEEPTEQVGLQEVGQEVSKAGKEPDVVKDEIDIEKGTIITPDMIIKDDLSVIDGEFVGDIIQEGNDQGKNTKVVKVNGSNERGTSVDIRIVTKDGTATRTVFVKKQGKREKVKAFRTEGLEFGAYTAHRGTGKYYSLDTPFTQGKKGEKVSEVELDIDRSKVLDITETQETGVENKDSKEYKSIVDEATKRKKPLNLEGAKTQEDINKRMSEDQRELFDLIRDVALERGYEGVISYIEPGAPSTDRMKEIGREYVDYTEGKKQQPPQFQIKDDIDVQKVRTSGRPGKKVSKGLSKKGTKAPVISETENLSLEYVKEKNPDTKKLKDNLFIKNARVLASYPLVRGVKKIDKIETVEQAQEVYDIFVRQAADNLNFLIKNFNPELVEISTLWYDGANKMANELAEKYGVTSEQVAGIMASLSPQKDWYQNVRLAEMVLEAYAENPEMTTEMVEYQKLINENSIYKAQKSPAKNLEKAKAKYRKSRSKKNLAAVKKAEETLNDRIEKADAVIKLLESYVGKPMDKVPVAIQTYMARLYHEVNTSKDYNIITPDGRKSSIAKTDKGENAKVAWGSYAEIGKAASIYSNGSQENISRSLGMEHKIRNFYNNIIDPMSPDNDVTIDTHAVGAALFKAVSGKSKEVKQNFGTGGASSSAADGVKGIYYAIAEAYVLAAKENNLLPRQVQSITWEAVRGLYQKDWKANEQNVSDINEIWNDYEEGKISIEEARDLAVKRAGGIQDPSWAGGPLQEELRDGVEEKGDRRRSDRDGRDTVGDGVSGRAALQIIGENAELSQQVRDGLVMAKGLMEIYDRVVVEKDPDWLEAMGRDLDFKAVHTPEMIRQATGWSRGKDGRWRYEIQDGRIVTNATALDGSPSPFFTKPGGKIKNGLYKLKDIYDAPDLYKAYPDLKDVVVTINVREQGKENSWFYPDENTIEINVKSDYRVIQDLVHEIQHWIQFKEGFALGGNQDTFFENPELVADLMKQKGKLLVENEIFRAMSFAVELSEEQFDDVPLSEFFTEEFLEENDLLDESHKEHLLGYGLMEEGDSFGKMLEDFYKSLSRKDRRELAEAKEDGDLLWGIDMISEPTADALSKLGNHAMYERLAGEVEARNVTDRLNMSLEARKKRPLESTEDVDSEDQILFFGDKRKISEQDRDNYQGFINLLGRSFPSMQVASTKEEFDKLLNSPATKGLTSRDKKKIYGAVYQGVLYLNPDLANYNTPVHEFGHVWMNFAKERNKKVYDKGMELIENSPYLERVKKSAEYRKIVEQMRKDGSTSKEIKQYLLEEALATAIGDRGESFVSEAQKKSFRNWLTKLYQQIAKITGISKYTAEQLETISLDEFLDAVNADLLSGKELLEGTEVVDNRDLQLQIVGERANLSQEVMDNLSRARQMEASGLSKDEIWHATGWERGAEGKWRHEISYSKVYAGVLKKSVLSLFNGPTPYQSLKLQSIIYNPELFEVYPELADVEVTLTVNPLVEFSLDVYTIDASFNPDESIEINLPKGFDTALQSTDKNVLAAQTEFLAVLNHEVQHWIQKREGFGRGSSPENSSRQTNQVVVEALEAVERIAKRIDRRAGEIGISPKSIIVNTINQAYGKIDPLIEAVWFDTKLGTSLITNYETVESFSRISALSDARKRLKALERDVKSKSGIDFSKEFRRITAMMETAFSAYIAMETLSDFQLYRRVSGEVEANNVMKRMLMSPEKRKATRLERTEEIDRKSQIIVDQTRNLISGIKSEPGRKKSKGDPRNIIAEAQQKGFTNEDIKRVLISQGFDEALVNSYLDVQLDLLTEAPSSFDRVEGGAIKGLELFQDVKERLDKYANRKSEKTKKKPTPEMIRKRAMDLMMNNSIWKAQPENIQAELLIAFDQLLGITVNQTVDMQITNLKNMVTPPLDIKQVKKKFNKVLRGLGVPKELKSGPQVKQLATLISNLTDKNYDESIKKAVEIIDVMLDKQLTQQQRANQKLEKQKAESDRKLNDLKKKLDDYKVKAASVVMNQKQIIYGKTMLSTLIKTTLPKGELTKEEVKRLFVRIEKVKNQKDFKTEADNTVKLIEKIRERLKKKRIKEIASVVKEISELKVTQSGKVRTKGKVDARTHEYFGNLLPVINTIMGVSPYEGGKLVRTKKGIQNSWDSMSDLKDYLSSEKTLELIDEIESKLINGEIVTPKEQALLDLRDGVNLLGDIDLASLEDVESILSDLKKLKKEGRSFLSEKLQREKEERARIRLEANEEISKSMPFLFIKEGGIASATITVDTKKDGTLYVKSVTFFNEKGAVMNRYSPSEFEGVLTNSKKTDFERQVMAQAIQKSNIINGKDPITQEDIDRMEELRDIGILDEYEQAELKALESLMEAEKTVDVTNEALVPRNRDQLERNKTDISEDLKKLKVWSALRNWGKAYKGMDTPKKALEFFRNRLSTLETFCNILDRKGTWFRDNIYRPLNRMEEARLANTQKQESILESIARSVGAKSIKKMQRDVSKKRIKLMVRGELSVLNGDDMMRLIALSRNEAQMEKLKAMGITQLEIDQMEGIVGSQAVDFVDAIVGYLSTEYYDQINNVYRSTYNINMPYIENYFPTETLTANPKGTDFILEGNFGKAFEADAASALKQRSDMTSDVKIETADGFFGTLSTHIESMERFKSYAEGTKKLQTAWKTKAVQTALAATNLNAIMGKTIALSINPQGMPATPSRVANWLQSKYTGYALAWKTIQILKQASSFIQAMPYFTVQPKLKVKVPGIDLLAFTVAHATTMLRLVSPMKTGPLANPVYKAAGISATFKDRLRQGFRGELETLVSGIVEGRTRKPGWKKNRFRRGLRIAAGAPTVIGDILGVLGYMTVYEQNIRNGMSKEEALEKFNEYNATQQTRRGTERVGLQQPTGDAQEFKRVFAAFGSTLFLQLNKVAQTSKNISRAIRDGKLPKKSDINSLIINYAVANMLFVASANIMKLTRGDDEEKEEVYARIKEAMFGLTILFKMPFLGGAIESAYREWQGERPFGTTGVNPALNVYKDVSKAIKDKDALTGAKVAGELIMGMQFDVPTSAVKAMGGDYSQENVQDLMGLSTSYRVEEPEGYVVDYGKISEEELKRKNPGLYKRKKQREKEMEKAQAPREKARKIREKSRGSRRRSGR